MASGLLLDSLPEKAGQPGCVPKQIAVVSADLRLAQDKALAEWARHKQEMQNYVNSWLERQEHLLQGALSLGRDASSMLSQKGRGSLASAEATLHSTATATLTPSPGQPTTVSVADADEADVSEEKSAGNCLPGHISEESSTDEVWYGGLDLGRISQVVEENFKGTEPEADQVGAEPTPRNSSKSSRQELLKSKSFVQRQRVAELAERLRMFLEPKIMPKPMGRLAEVVESTQFVILCTTVIFMDTIFTAIEANRSMSNPGVDTPTWTFLTEITFTIFYSGELFLKLLLYGRYFFCNEDRAWNLMDLFLVAQGVSDVILTLALSGDGGDVTFIRLLKLLRLWKILRIFRAIRFLRELRVMLLSIVRCLSILFWAFVMLTLIMYVFALIFIQLFSTHFDIAALENRDAPERVAAMRFFGNVGRTMISLFQGASGGVDWYELFDVVVILGPLGTFAFIFYIGFFQYAVVNILGGIFLQNALAESLPDRETEALERRRAEDAEAEELKQVFEDITGASTRIDFQDLVKFAQDPRKKMHLRALGLDICDAVMFFEMMTEALGVTQLPMDEFIGRLCHMKGTASAIDLQAMAYEVTIVRRMLNKLLEGDTSRQSQTSQATNVFKHMMAPLVQHRKSFNRTARRSIVNDRILMGTRTRADSLKR